MDLLGAESKVALRYFCFLILITLGLSSCFISCEQSEKSKFDPNEFVPAFNENQKELFDNYVHRLQEFPNISNDFPSETQLNWKYYHSSPELDNLITKYNLLIYNVNGGES